MTAHAITPIDGHLLNDGAFQFGYGCFETVLVTQGTPILLDYHINRMAKTADFLSIPFDHDRDSILKQVADLVEGVGYPQGIMKWILTAGDREANFRFSQPKLLMTLTPHEVPKEPKTLSLTLMQDPYPRSELDAHKTLNYLKPILHRQGCEPGEDIVFYDEDGYLLEATTSNVWVLNEEGWHTPDHPYILPGTFRDYLLNEGAEEGLATHKRPIHRSELDTCKGVCLTNSVTGISWGEFK